ncbi:MAG: hypothetical protein VR65_05260 [Desulfobulbaceae bacterium BRH_c16a]|nr:MAG: hypothetical protein VR65_05260 [Desulfobulbaceae bacterium BRH_c16a]
MERAISHLRFILLITLAALSIGTTVEAAEKADGILVGRIFHIEGKLLRYVEEDKDWVVTVEDSPFGLEDALYSEEDTQAEIILPNRTRLRIGENTQIQLIDLNPEATTVDVGAGKARLYNRSDDTVIKVTTPFGYAVASANTIFDLYVGDESLEVIPIRGTMEFVHAGSDIKYRLSSGSYSLIADYSDASRGEGAVDSYWDDWNEERDSLWNKRIRSKTYSTGFLPEQIREESYVLDETGRWERVYYEGEYHNMWRPIRVEKGWRPFTVGRWTVYYGDNCWIPDEPFGYVTHHYGSWVYVETRRHWYWVPPVARVVSRTPRFYIGFGWYPGRVGWIHRDSYVGWVPLAPHEVYYGYRPWGHRTVIVNPTVSLNVNVNLVNFSFIHQAIVVHRDHFYRGSRYTPYVERNIGRDVIINNYQPVTVINNTVINNFFSDSRRFAYSDREVFRKPHRTVIDRITENKIMKRDFGSFSRDRIKNDLTRIRAVAEPMKMKGSHRLSVSNKLVEENKIDRSFKSLNVEKKDLKGKNQRIKAIADNGEMIRSADGEKGKKQLKPSKEKRDNLSMNQLNGQQEVQKGGKKQQSSDRQEVAEKKIGKKQEAGKGETKSNKQSFTTEQTSGGKGNKKIDKNVGQKDHGEEIQKVQQSKGAGKKSVEQQPNHKEDRKIVSQNQKEPSKRSTESPSPRKQEKRHQQQGEDVVSHGQEQHQKKGKKND